MKYRGPIQKMRKGMNIVDVDRIKLDYSVQSKLETKSISDK